MLESVLWQATMFWQDMDLDEGDMDSAPTGNFTEELNSFYSEIGKECFLLIFSCYEYGMKAWNKVKTSVCQQVLFH